MKGETSQHRKRGPETDQRQLRDRHDMDRRPGAGERDGQHARRQPEPHERRQREGRRQSVERENNEMEGDDHS